MATVISTYWINPLTNSVYLPTAPGEILQAAVSYWEDELNEWRPKRPRLAAAKAERERRVTEAVDRLNRFRDARDQYATDIRKLDKLTLQLATNDLTGVMKPARAVNLAA